jgi:dynein heavy chain 1
MNLKMEDLQTRLERSENLIEELAKEKDRWINLEKLLETKQSKLQGDCLISAAFLS